MPNLFGALGALMYSAAIARTPDPVAEQAAEPPTPPPVPQLHHGERLNHGERARLRTAAGRARQVYPGPVGQLLARELLAWDDFGFRFGDGGLIFGVVTDIEQRAAPAA